MLHAGRQEGESARRRKCKKSRRRECGNFQANNKPNQFFLIFEPQTHQNAPDQHIRKSGSGTSHRPIPCQSNKEKDFGPNWRYRTCKKRNRTANAIEKPK
jgi:hypothetical protein